MIVWMEEWKMDIEWVEGYREKAGSSIALVQSRKCYEAICIKWSLIELSKQFK